MIKIDSTSTIISGELDTILYEMTTALRKLYFIMVENLGVDQANKYFVDMGRLAIMSEE